MIIFNFFQEYTVQRPWRITNRLMHTDTLSLVSQTIKYFTRNSIFIEKFEVRPSYRTSDNPHVPWITLSATGSIIAGHCTYMVGYEY